MSKVRGIFPLFLVTTIGVANGVWVFGPSLKEQQEERALIEEKKAEAIAPVLAEKNLTTLADTEATISRNIATENALKPEKHARSWWQGAGFWNQPSSPPIKTREESPILTKDSTLSENSRRP